MLEVSAQSGMIFMIGWSIRQKLTNVLFHCRMSAHKVPGSKHSLSFKRATSDYRAEQTVQKAFASVQTPLGGCPLSISHIHYSGSSLAIPQSQFQQAYAPGICMPSSNACWKCRANCHGGCVHPPWCACMCGGGHPDVELQWHQKRMPFFCGSSNVPFTCSKGKCWHLSQTKESVYLPIDVYFVHLEYSQTLSTLIIGLGRSQHHT